MISLADDDELITLAEAAKRVKTTRDRLLKMAQQGRIEAHYIEDDQPPKFDPEECDAFAVELAEERSQKAQAQVEKTKNASSNELRHQVLRDEAMSRQTDGQFQSIGLHALERELRDRRMRRIEESRKNDLASVVLATVATGFLAWQLKQQNQKK